MISPNLLTETCSIYEKSVTFDKWLESTTYNSIYTNIPCHYYKQSWKVIISNDWSKNTLTWTYKISVNPQFNNLKRGYLVEVTDSILWLLGKFVIDDIKPNKFWWKLDSFTIILTKIVKWT